MNYFSKIAGKIWRNDGNTVNFADYLDENTSTFNEQLVVSREPVLVLNNNINLSDLRDVQTTANGGTIAQQNSEYKLNATSTADSKARLDTKEQGEYQVGFRLVPGLGVRTEGTPTGTAYFKWGYFDDNNGIYMEKNKDGLYFKVMSGGSEVYSVEQANFKFDNLDGDDDLENPSGDTLDTDVGLIYHFPFSFYAYGYIDAAIQVESPSGKGMLETVDTIKIDNKVSVEDPSLPIRAEVFSGDGGSELSLYVGGRQICREGKTYFKPRTRGERRLEQTGIGTTPYPMLSVQQKSAFTNINVTLARISVIANADMILEVHRNVTLSGYSFVSPTGHDASETATEWDSSATSFTGGALEDSFLVQTDRKEGFKIADLPFNRVNNGDIWTFALRRISGTGGTASMIAKAYENW